MTNSKPFRLTACRLYALHRIEELWSEYRRGAYYKNLHDSEGISARIAGELSRAGLVSWTLGEGYLTDAGKKVLAEQREKEKSR